MHVAVPESQVVPDLPCQKKIISYILFALLSHHFGHIILKISMDVIGGLCVWKIL